MKNEIIRKTILISHDNLESCILGFLYATKTIPESWDVLTTELGVPLNEDGLVEIEIECVKPRRKTKDLRSVSDDYVVYSEQLEFPLEVFDNVYVKGS